MAVVAVMLATVVTATISGGDAPDTSDDYPHASFTFSAENTTVLVTHYGGDAMNGSRLYVESESRGRLGNFAGTDGTACAANVTRIEPGSTCRVPDAIYDKLYVVWEGPADRNMIFARRLPDPTPSPTPTPTPNTTTTTIPENSTGTSTGADAPPREMGTVTSTPGPNTSTRTPGNRTTATPTPTTDGGGTATETPGTTTRIATATE